MKWPPLSNANCTAFPPSLRLGFHGGRVKEYRVYSIDECGRIVGERTIEALSDDDALFDVRSMQRPLTTELWLGDRRIGRVPPRAVVAREWPLPEPRER